MERRKWPPLTDEDKQEICKKCGGFCCNYFFVWVGDEDAPKEFQKFRGRKIQRYGDTLSVIQPDPCPFAKKEEDGNGWCTVYETRPEVCRIFPQFYTPFWNLHCKLMRELYKRGKLPKNIDKFKKLIKNPKVKSVFKFFKN